MTFSELIHNRYSVRDYDPRPVEQEKLSAILEAGRAAPTAKNNQPQKIYVLQSEAAVQKIRSLAECAYNAPVVLLVGYDDTLEWNNPFDTSFSSGETDASIVCTHMMLAAAEQGIGSCWVGWFDHAAVEQAFALPANIRLTALLPLGYPSTTAAPSARHGDRKPINETVSVLDVCPVCGVTPFAAVGDVCPVCGWEHDRVQERDPSFAGGANKQSLNEAKAAYRKGTNRHE